jgi:putative transcriptional regulator
MSTINRHPDATTLMSFAAGSLPEPLSAGVAAHVAMCTGCRHEMRDMELIGTELLRAMPGRTAYGGGPAMPAKPQEPVASAGRSPARGTRADKLPAPLAHRYGLVFDDIAWRPLAPGIWHHRLALSPGVEGDLRLFKIAAGCKIPMHRHGGMEITVVLDGAFVDETGEYRRGDVLDLDEETAHEPLADKELGCICLIGSEQPIRA